MRAMAVANYDAPLEPIDVEEPVLRQGEALLEIVTCAVCFNDLKTVRGRMPFSDTLPLPHVPGHDIFGIVRRTEPSGLVVEGTRAVVYHHRPCGRCTACRRGDETLCSCMVAWTGFTHPGSFTERIAVSVDRLVPIPDGIEALHAAPMSCALGTAYRSVVRRGALRAGTSAVVLGLGGIGIHAAQIARAAGAHTVGFDLDARALDAARWPGIRWTTPLRFTAAEPPPSTEPLAEASSGPAIAPSGKTLIGGS